MFDDTDLRVVDLLKKNGRLSWTDLSKELGLSVTSTADRVRKLEEAGVIKGYAAIIDQKMLGNKIVAFITVTLVKPLEKGKFAGVVRQTDMIEECYHIAGEGSYILKVRGRDIEDLEKLVNRTLKAIPEVVKTVTIIALAEIK